jgi:DNA-binding NarL/FixJ family response regulator
MASQYPPTVRSRIASDNDRSSSEFHTWSPQVLRIALIDRQRLARECFVSAALIAQPLLAITPFENVEIFAKVNSGAFDLTLYIDRGHGTSDIRDLSLIIRHVPPKRLLIVASETSVESVPLLKEFESRSGFVIQAMNASLQLVISSLFILRYRGTDDLVPHESRIVPRTPQPDLVGAGEGATLTDRERAVLALVRQGHSNKEIAQALLMSISTVKVHVRHLLQKTQSNNRIQLILPRNRHQGPA